MEERGIKANRLVADLSLHTSAVTEWKQGKSKPSTDAIVKIADYFGVTTDYLLKGVPQERLEDEKEKNMVINTFEHLCTLFDMIRVNESKHSLARNKPIEQELADCLGIGVDIVDAWLVCNFENQPTSQQIKEIGKSLADKKYPDKTYLALANKCAFYIDKEKQENLQVNEHEGTEQDSAELKKEAVGQ